MCAPVYVRDCQRIVLCDPLDLHTHLRKWGEGGLLAKVLPFTGMRFTRYLVMPNVPAVDTDEQLVEYRLEIGKLNRWQSEPLMTFKVGPSTTAEIVARCKAAGAIAGKLYPDGVTTGSEGGVRDFRALWPVFAAMERCGLVLCLHGEMPGAFVLEREIRFLKVLRDILEDFPRLRIVLEHITTAQAVRFVREHASRGARLAATITAHHLSHTLDDLIGGKLAVHRHCQPTYKDPRARQALIGAALSGEPWFFFGSDTAPHILEAKHCEHAACGVFSAPVALETVVEVFDKCGGTLKALRNFLSKNGKRFYRLRDLPGHKVTLVREPWQFSTSEILAATGVHPWRGGETIAWSIKEGIPKAA